MPLPSCWYAKKNLGVGFSSSPVFMAKDNDNPVGALFYGKGRNLGLFEVQDKPEIGRMRPEANLGKEFVIRRVGPLLARLEVDRVRQ